MTCFVFFGGGDLKILQMDREKWKLLSVAGLHQRRLSSTPIKLPQAREQRQSPEINGGAVKGHDEEEESSSEAHDDVKDTERVVDPPGFPSGVCYPVPSEPPYDKRSYQDDNGESEDAVSSIGDDEDDDSSTLEDDKDATTAQVVFDDDSKL